MEEIIKLIHTNDLHSHFEQWPKIRRWINSHKLIYKEQAEEVFEFDIGDFLDKVHPLTEATTGKGNVDLMNEVDYDAVTIGNNEGITNSKTQLDELYENANFSIVLANLLDDETKENPKWASEYKTLETNLGTKIAVIGLTAPMPLTYKPFGWEVLEPLSVLSNILPSIKKSHDVVILLSHLGLPDDKRIAEYFPDIDVILGSHTHHHLPTGLVLNGVLIAAAGRFGEFIGEVKLKLVNSKIIEKDAYTIDVELLDEDESDEEEIKGYEVSGKAYLDERHVVNLPYTLEKESSLIEFALKAIRDYSGCDLALLSSGLFLTDLVEGEVTERNIHECLPHPMNLIKVTMKAQDLLRLAMEINKNKLFLKRFPVIGMKFRGKYFGEIWYDGLVYHPEKKMLFIHDEPLDMKKTYSFVTVDHIAYLPFFPSIELSGEVELLGPDFLRNCVSNYLKKLDKQTK